MAGPVVPVAAWMAKVSQRNAPGAIKAIALLVSPVSPSVFFISPVDTFAMCSPSWSASPAETAGLRNQFLPQLNSVRQVWKWG